MSEESVIAALRALAEQDRGREAPEYVEARVLQAFARKQTHRRWRNGLGWSLAAAAAMTVLFAGLRGRQPDPQPIRYVAPSRKVAAKPPQLAAASPPLAEFPDAERTTPANARRPPLARPAPPRNLTPVAPTREVVTDFFPLLKVAPPFERGELLRVMVPASTMRRVGLPVNEDRLADPVYADVLVGQDGLARAIRFVSYEQ
jgi:hypothetical protein